MRILLLLPLLFFLFFACGEAPAPAAQESIDEGVTLEAVPGSVVQQFTRRDPVGNVVERGFLRDGVRTGAWAAYTPERNAPEKTYSYVDGVLNGPYLEFDDRGRIQLAANYRAGQLHGPYGTFRIGTPTLTATYVDGQLHGPMAEYFSRNGKIKQEVNYKMGKKHGLLRYFNEEGEVTLEYTYENDEKISGGIVK